MTRDAPFTPELARLPDPLAASDPLFDHRRGIELTLRGAEPARP